jgi:hypothetical protein
MRLQTLVGWLEVCLGCQGLVGPLAPVYALTTLNRLATLKGSG